MAYAPPHKRLSKNHEGPSPTPDQLVPQFRNSLNLHPSRSGRRSDKKATGMKIVYAHQSISRWSAVPLTENGEFPSSVRFVPVSVEEIEQKSGEKPLTLVNEPSSQDGGHDENSHLEHPWVALVRAVHSDLLSSVHNVKNELVDQSLEETKPKLVARFGKVLFHRKPSLSLDSLKEFSVSESYVRDLRRIFYTNLPLSYMEHVKIGVLPKLGAFSKEEKEVFHVKLSDAKQPDSTISCKCRVQEGENRLHLYKIELNNVRHLIEDVSCLDSGVDLRLALCTKKTRVSFTDEEKLTISDLVSSAILDPNVKGGLRWPLGKANSGGRFSVVGVWHTKTDVYSSSSIKLKVREADRFDFVASTGEVTREIVLKLTEITRNLLELKGDAEAVSTMLEDALKQIYQNFLAWDSNVVSCCES